MPLRDGHGVRGIEKIRDSRCEDYVSLGDWGSFLGGFYKRDERFLREEPDTVRRLDDIEGTAPSRATIGRTARGGKPPVPALETGQFRSCSPPNMAILGIGYGLRCPLLYSLVEDLLDRVKRVAERPS